MKNVSLFSITAMFFVANLFFFNLGFAQTNIGFAKAAGLEEGKAFSSFEAACDRFIFGVQNSTIGPLFAERISQSFKNSGNLYGGTNNLTSADVVTILRWVKTHPANSSVYGVSIYKLPKGDYTFETLTKKSGKWVAGNQITRTAHAGEWCLEFWGQKVASSWCLNLFASVGVITPPAPVTKTVTVVDTVYKKVVAPTRPVCQALNATHTCWAHTGIPAVTYNHFCDDRHNCPWGLPASWDCGAGERVRHREPVCDPPGPWVRVRVRVPKHYHGH